MMCPLALKLSVAQPVYLWVTATGYVQPLVIQQWDREYKAEPQNHLFWCLGRIKRYTRAPPKGPRAKKSKQHGTLSGKSGRSTYALKRAYPF